MTDWIKRAYDRASDENAVVALWLKSYAHAKVNTVRGANRDGTDAERRYWREHAPIVETLLASASTKLLCDPERVYPSEAGPAIILAFACFTGDDVVHYVCVKRKYAPEFGAEMVRDLLGERLARACVCSHELVEMRPSPTRPAPCGVSLPSSWREDSWWLARQLLGGARAA